MKSSFNTSSCVLLILITLEITYCDLKQENTLPAFALKLPNRIRKWVVPRDMETSAANAVIEIKQEYSIFSPTQFNYSLMLPLPIKCTKCFTKLGFHLIVSHIHIYMFRNIVKESRSKTIPTTKDQLPQVVRPFKRCHKL